MKLLLVVLIFAAVTYLAIRWMQDRGHGGSPAARKPSRPQPPSRPVAPDDDDRFLRDLEWKRRQAEKREPKAPPAPAPEQPDKQPDKQPDQQPDKQPDQQPDA